MILIVTDLDEPTTDFVLDWIRFHKEPFIRISSEDVIEIDRIYLYENCLEADIKIIRKDESQFSFSTKEIISYWYRRSNIKIKNVKFLSEDSTNEFVKLVNNYMFVESKEAYEILNGILSKKHRINGHDDVFLNKTLTLEKALKFGLRIPRFIITTKKNELKRFVDENEIEIVTKTIGDPTCFFAKGIHQFTTRIVVEELPEEFGITLFQEEILKYAELRVYFLHDVFYGSIIFSQSDSETEVDLKNYNVVKPNRISPFELPDDIELKLRKFMNGLNLTSGSLDIIVDRDFNFIFLEVNPIGQFEQVSIPCNYNLFNIVAKNLIHGNDRN